MKCKKCDNKLNFGKTVCHHCGFDNGLISTVDNNLNNMSENNSENDENNHKIIVTAIKFILLVTFIIAFTFIVISNNFDKIISATRIDNEDITETYENLEESVSRKIMIFSPAACDENCVHMYNYDDSIYDFEVTDMGEYYLLEFEIEDYINFDNSYCDTLEVVYCYGNEIKGKLYE